MSNCIIGIPMGDPSGIGPEIIIKTLADKETYEISRPVIVGDACVLEQMNALLGAGLKVNRITSPCDGQYEFGTVDVIDLKNVDLSELKFGQVQAASGKAAFEYIKKACELAMLGEIAVMATTPINKESVKAGNVGFIGHTEMLAQLSGTEDPLTMFQVHDLRVFFLSRHVSLANACGLVKKDKIVSYLKKCDVALTQLGIGGRRLIAVAGLNPHNGEHGLFGDDESREIEPAVAEAVAAGINATGPVSADSVFSQALHGKFDAVLSLYHDQGHIATKTLDFEKTISLTIGMPFLRTSVDHGTAFDIAGKGVASAVSMKEAIRIAAQYGPTYAAEKGRANACKT